MECQVGDTVEIRQGLTKTVKHLGNGDMPMAGQLCTVHYGGNLK